MTFVDRDLADAGIGIRLAGRPQPMMQSGRAVLVDGVWKVSSRTRAHFAGSARNFPPRGPFGP